MYKMERNNFEKLSGMVEKNKLSTEIRNVCPEIPWLDTLETQILANNSSVTVLTPYAPSSGFTKCFDHGTLFN
jgi:hypothetical protein